LNDYRKPTLSDFSHYLSHMRDDGLIPRASRAIWSRLENVLPLFAHGEPGHVDHGRSARHAGALERIPQCCRRASKSYFTGPQPATVFSADGDAETVRDRLAGLRRSSG